MAGVPVGGGYDDYDPHSTENEPEWPSEYPERDEKWYDAPEYQPDEEPPEDWVGFAEADRRARWEARSRT